MKAELGTFPDWLLSDTITRIERDIAKSQSSGDIASVESGFVFLSEVFIKKHLPLSALLPLQNYLANIFPEFKEKCELGKKQAQWVVEHLPPGTPLIMSERIPDGTVLPLTHGEAKEYLEHGTLPQKH